MTAPKERGLICRGPEALAIWEGRQTQVRRLVKPQPQRISAEDPGWVLNVHAEGRGGTITWDDNTLYRRQELLSTFCPYGKVGDVVFVKETIDALFGCDMEYVADQTRVADTVGLLSMKQLPCKTIPANQMPRWAARSVRQITEVRVERLTDISETDAIAHGVYKNGPDVIGHHPWVAPGVLMTNVYGDKCYDVPCHNTARDAYETLWKSLNGPDSWGPHYVWVVSFRKLEAR